MAEFFNEVTFQGVLVGFVIGALFVAFLGNVRPPKR